MTPKCTNCDHRQHADLCNIYLGKVYGTEMLGQLPPAEYCDCTTTMSDEALERLADAIAKLPMHSPTEQKLLHLVSEQSNTIKALKDTVRNLSEALDLLLNPYFRHGPPFGDQDSLADVGGSAHYSFGPTVGQVIAAKHLVVSLKASETA